MSHIEQLNDDWVYCHERLPENHQPVWWAIQCTAGQAGVLVHAGTIHNGCPQRGWDNLSYKPDFYHEYIAWKNRPITEPAPPEYQKGILPERDVNGSWSLTAKAKKY